MMLISTNAIVLKSIPYGDSSIICRLFTEDQGKITVMAKGAWKPKKTTGPLLEPMNQIHLQYYNKNSRDIQILKDAELIRIFSILRSDLNRIILGQVVVEAIDKSTQINNSLPIIYRLGWRVLDKMNHADVNHWLVFAFYLYQLSMRLGFMPNLKTCCQCKSVFRDAFIDDMIGELICHECSPKSKISLSKKSLIFLQKLAYLHLDDIHPGMTNTAEIYPVLRFLQIFICIHIDGINRVRSLEMIHKLLI
jgi:DNA repair protein RecO (recombination protein O)